MDKERLTILAGGMLDRAKEEIIKDQFLPTLILLVSDAKGGEHLYYMADIVDMLRNEKTKNGIPMWIDESWYKIASKENGVTLDAVVFVCEAFLSSESFVGKHDQSKFLKDPGIKQVLMLIISMKDGSTIQEFEFRDTTEGRVFMEDEKPIKITSSHGPFADLYPNSAKK